MKGLTVAVVGAGIAGLTVAAALARHGALCTVFEQAERFDPVGGGIQLSPNATRLLGRLGLTEQLDEVALRPAAIELRRWDTDRLIARTRLGAACESSYGAPYYTLHRADLHRALVDLVQRPPGRTTIHMGRRCVAVRESDGGVELSFADASRATADLVVGADGIHSLVRGTLVEDEPRFTGMTVYRGLSPSGRLPRSAVRPRVRIWLGPRQHCVCYPVRGGRLVSFVAAVPGDGWTTRSWTTPARVEDLLAAYEGWHGEVRAVLAAGTSVTRWALYQRATPHRWHSGRRVIVGDAAHPMLPFGAQGANQAIESAATLALCLRESSDLTAALRRYEDIRSPRLAQVGSAVRQNAADHHLIDGARQRSRDRAMTDRHSLANQGWLYGYDAERAAATGGVR